MYLPEVYNEILWFEFFIEILFTKQKKNITRKNMARQELVSYATLSDRSRLRRTAYKAVAREATARGGSEIPQYHTGSAVKDRAWGCRSWFRHSRSPL